MVKCSVCNKKMNEMPPKMAMERGLVVPLIPKVHKDCLGKKKVTV